MQKVLFCYHLFRDILYVNAIFIFFYERFFNSLHRSVSVYIFPHLSMQRVYFFLFHFTSCEEHL